MSQKEVGATALTFLFAYCVLLDIPHIKKQKVFTCCFIAVISIDTIISNQL